jgi:sugar phosphate isomerase/epimerase
MVSENGFPGQRLDAATHLSLASDHMVRSAVTISLVPEMRGGPFVFHDSLAAGCARASSLGFDAVELFFDEAGAVDVGDLKSLLDTHKLAVSAFGSGAGWVKHQLRLTDPDDGVRRRAIEYILELIEVAARFDAPVIVGSMQGRHDAGVSRVQALDWLSAALSELGEAAGRHGLPLLYEFLNRYETNLFNTVGDSLGFLDTAGCPSVKLLCDLFHMNIEERDIPAALRLAGAKIGHVHFADTNRRAVGMGHMDAAPIAAVLRDIHYNGYISAEVLPLPDGDAAARQTIESFRKFFPC